MKKREILLVIGGDMRQIYAAKKLTKHFDVYCLGFDKAGNKPQSVSFAASFGELPDSVDHILLPPVMSNEAGFVNAPFAVSDITFRETAEHLKTGGRVFGGRFTQQAASAYGAKAAVMVNYLESNVFNIRNAVPTAEGALKIAIEETPVTIYGSNVLVVGYGRIGRVLTKMLYDLGAEVTVAARAADDLAAARIMGCRKTVPFADMGSCIKGEMIVFNTVPVMCLDENALAEADSRCLIIDLASRPGGVDKAAAEYKGVRVIHALGLPGRFSPVTAGEMIAETVLDHIYPKGEGIE